MTDSTSIRVAESAIRAMKEAAHQSLPIETGGVLAGVLSQGRPWVTHALELPTDDRGLAHYRLPAKATGSAIRSIRKTDARLGYLGDWHSHPSDMGPSALDFATLGVMSVLALGDPMPILLVVRAATWPVAFRMDRGLLKECQLITTGDLPRTSDGSWAEEEDSAS